MSKESGPSRFWWFTAGAAASAATLLGADVAVQKIDQIPSNIDEEIELVTPEFEPPEDPGERHLLSMDVAPLSPEVEMRYVGSTVGVEMAISQLYPNIQGARGTATRVGPGRYLTAAHITLDAEREDGTIVSVIADSGEDIRDGVWIEVNGERLRYIHEWSFPEFETGDLSYDVAAYGVEEAAGLPALNIANPEAVTRGTEVFLYSRYGDENAQVFAGEVAYVPTEDDDYQLMVVIFRVNGDSDICFNGVSGTSLINREGEIAGVIHGGNVVVVTPEIAEQYGLAESEVGQEVAICDAVTASTAAAVVSG